MRSLSVLMLLLSACDGGDGETEYGSTDTRIDMAGDEGDPDSWGTRMCVDSSGVVYVVWTDDRDGSSDVWLNRSNDAGRNWMPASVRVNAETGQTAENPDVACTDNGVYVAWEDDRDGELENKNIYFNWSEDGETFQDADQNLDLDEDGATMSKGPRIAATGDRVHVVWFDDIDGAYDIYSASSLDSGETFGEPVRVDADDAGDAYSAWPELAVDRGGYIYVSWEDSRDGASDVYVAVSDDSGTSFAADVRLDLGDDEGENDSFEPRIAAEDGVVYVVWHDDRNGEGRDVYLNYSSDNGATWASEAERVDSDQAGFFDSLYPAVAVTGGVAHIAFMDARNLGFDIYYRSHDGTGFTAEEARLDTDSRGTANSIYPVVVASEEFVVVGWEDLRYDYVEVGYNDLFYNYSEDGGATFQSYDLRIDSWEDGTKYTDDLALAIHRQELMCGWTDGRRGSDDVFFTALTIGEESTYVAPPSDGQ